jgi:stage V sporulation protein B
MLNISLPVALSSYIRSGLNTYKQIMIPLGLQKSGISSDMAIAQYGMIRGMVMPVIMFPSALLSAFSSLLIPEIAEKHIQKKNNDISIIISKIFKVTLLFSICISGILFSYANELSIAIYKNPDAGVFIKIFAPLIIIMYLDDIVDAILKGLNEQVHVVIINIFDTILSICLLYTLLPICSIKGYIIVIFASELFNSSLSIWRLIKVTSFDLKIIKWVILPIVIIIVCLAITKFLIRSNLILSIIIVLALYSIILYTIGVITKKDLIL